MAELTTIARPYAKAAFEFAKSQKQIPAWSTFLQITALVVSDKRVRYLLDHPRVPTAKIITLISDICGEHINDAQRNLLTLLGAYRRLVVLPEIAILFQARQKEQEKEIMVTVSTAYPLSHAEIERLTNALEIRLQHDITLSVKLDKGLLGGVVIQAGDFVIDGSLRGKLSRLETAILT